MDQSTFSPNPIATWKSIVRVIVFTALILVLGNVFFAMINPDLGHFSLYGRLWHGRERLPFGETPHLAYNFSMYNVDAMLKSHKIDSNDTKEEFVVLVIGDSSVWGTLLTNEQTLTGSLNRMGLIDEVSKKPVRFYNLGYPTISLTKDLMIMDQAVRDYQPDLVLWMVTLEAMPWERQLTSPVVQNNPEFIQDMSTSYNLPYDTKSSLLKRETFWDKTIFGRRRELADLIRLQLYGVMWAATGVDQYIPDAYTPAQRNLENDISYYGLTQETLTSDVLAFEVFNVGKTIATEEASTSVIIINEPIMISSGENSDLRYNFYYPKWAYDTYRSLLNQYAQARGIDYHDLWNIIPEKFFTNSAIHMNPEGEDILAAAITRILEEYQLTAVQ